jgi:hypothetical protein
MLILFSMINCNYYFKQGGIKLTSDSSLGSFMLSILHLLQSAF